MTKFLRRLALAAAACMGLAGTAEAHPHIFIDAKATLVFNDAGELSEIRNSWTFDELFSVWQIQGLDTDSDGITSPEEMQELADENFRGLAEFGYYTALSEDGTDRALVPLGDARFVHADHRSTLTFAVAPAEPVKPEGALELAIADPEYYIAIQFAGPGDISLENAPAGCGVRLEPPRELSPDVQARLGDLPPDVTRLPPDLEAALRGSQGGIVVDCPATAAVDEAATALEAVNEMAAARPATPFGGVQEPGLRLPRTGLLGWIQVTQEDFYRGLTAALVRLRSDWTAFWVLGGLSFLYGVFHAAGPGHGKVVIGSYMLANERQLKRGVRLSLAAAMLQSGVAVALVGVAAAILGLSSAVMDNAVLWVERVSYGLIALLGAWLVARRLFGWGHDHGATAVAGPHAHAEEPVRQVPAGLTLSPAMEAVGVADARGRLPGDAHYGHDHGHHDHGQHAHVVTADRTDGDWREQLGVVLGAGLRPCSGALVVLVFSLSQGILAAGIAAVFLMGLGTAITVAALATLAVGGKGLAARYLDGGSGLATRVLWWVELGAATVVFLFGALLLLASL